MKWIRLEVVKEEAPPYISNIKITHPMDVYSAVEAVKNLKKMDREVMLAILLNTKNRINGMHLVSIGTIDVTLCAPSEVFKAALLTNSTSVILVHNHPSGDPEPSLEDKEVARRLKEAGNLLGIKLLDFIIIGDNDYFSFKKEDLL